MPCTGAMRNLVNIKNISLLIIQLIKIIQEFISHYDDCVL
jgi:hypothetical protein